MTNDNEIAERLEAEYHRLYRDYKVAKKYRLYNVLRSILPVMNTIVKILGYTPLTS